jgi:hypothetical protein
MPNFRAIIFSPISHLFVPVNQLERMPPEFGVCPNETARVVPKPKVAALRGKAFLGPVHVEERRRSFAHSPHQSPIVGNGNARPGSKNNIYTRSGYLIFSIHFLRIVGTLILFLKFYLYQDLYMTIFDSL